MKNPSIAFIDNIFHQKTKSADFFKDLLRTQFNVVEFWDRTSQKGPRIDTETINRYPFVLFWQRLNPITDLEKINGEIVWVPMLDSVTFDFFFWKTLSFLPIKVLCFSKTLYDHCQKFGIKSIHIQYYSKPKWGELEGCMKNKNVFFWNRGSVPFSSVKTFLNPKKIDRLIYLSRPDPNFIHEPISEEDKEVFKMELIEMDFKSDKTEYEQLVCSSGIFIAPRKTEGIGLSFLEAMAYGSAVIAYNGGTMNEYIQHGVNGYLFTEQTDDFIDLSLLEDVRKRSKSSVESGYKKWLEDTERILNFITERMPVKRKGSFLHLIWRGLYLLKLRQHRVRMKYI